MTMRHINLLYTFLQTGLCELMSEINFESCGLLSFGHRFNQLAMAEDSNAW